MGPGAFWLLVRSSGALWLLVEGRRLPGRRLGVLGPPNCQLGTPELSGCRLGAPWLLVRGPKAPSLSLILLLITVMCVITEKKMQQAHR